MLDSSLRFAVRRAWREDTDHSDSVSSALIRAYLLLKRHPSQVASFLDAFDLLAPHVPYAMSLRQRMHLFYILGCALMAADEEADAATCFELALDVAQCELYDPKASAELLYLRAMAICRLLRYRDAAETLMTCLTLLGELPPAERTPATEEFEITVMTTLASFEFMSALYTEATEHLGEARARLAGCGDDAVGRATVDWIEALVYRWRAQPEPALKLAMAAADVYSTADIPNSNARIQAVVADVALDWAQHYPSGDARSAFLTIADPYIRRSHRQARTAHDDAAQGLAELAAARFSRLAHRNEDRIARIEEVIRYASRTNDVTLLAPAYTELGHEFSGRGLLASSRNCYQSALDILRHQQAAAMGVWAERALLDR
jgi:tetratricopeptide (TPR) repeat protein